jgi:MSHA pilin protein MshA
MKRQAGFTLIELVTVIVILGVLAAFALPRFSGLETQARVAALQGLEGSVRSASALAHAVWLAGGSDDDPITMDGVDIDIVNGYPSEAQIDNALQDVSGFDQTADGTFSPKGATDQDTCQVVYTEAASLGVAPSIVSDVTGC